MATSNEDVIRFRKSTFDIDEVLVNGKKEMKTVLLANIAWECVHKIKLDDYQREREDEAYLRAMIPTILNGNIQLTTVAFRGRQYVIVKDDPSEKDNGLVVDVKGPAYFIDGQQRQAAFELILATIAEWAKEHFPQMAERYNGNMIALISDAMAEWARLKKETPKSAPPDPPYPLPKIRAMVQFGTTYKDEKDQFQLANAEHHKVRAGRIIQNMMDEYSALADLWKLTKEDESSTLYKLVRWGDRVPGPSISVRTLLRVLLQLHINKGARKLTKNKELVEGYQQLANTIGLAQLNTNARTFFEVLEENLSIKEAIGRKDMPQGKGGLWVAIANVLGIYEKVFWKNNKDGKRFELIVPPKFRLSLRSFDLYNKTTEALVGGGGKALTRLSFELVEHFNHGKHKRNHLNPLELGARTWEEEEEDGADENDESLE